MSEQSRGSGDAPGAIGYSTPVTDVLGALGSIDGPLGSGVATALSLSLSVECLALHLELSRRVVGSDERSRYLNELEGRLGVWRDACRGAFTADQLHFGDVLVARRAQQAADSEGKRALADEEMTHLASANDVLLALLGVAHEIEAAADVMVSTHGSRVGEGEGATAGYLARAACESAATMLASNARSAANRGEALGVLLPRRAAIRAASLTLPSGRARDFLVVELDRLEAIALKSPRG